MKKLFSIITIAAALAVVMAACKNNPATMPISYQDTAGLAQFQQFQTWKTQQEQAMFQEWKLQQEQLNAAPVYSKNVVASRKSTTTSGSMNSSSTQNAKTPTKKGWSKAAKYSVIGGVTGAVLGVVINKRDRVKGGIIGGILGGGTGYGIGRSRDKKDGRY